MQFYIIHVLQNAYSKCIRMHIDSHLMFVGGHVQQKVRAQRQQHYWVNDFSRIVYSLKVGKPIDENKQDFNQWGSNGILLADSNEKVIFLLLVGSPR